MNIKWKINFYSVFDANYKVRARFKGGEKHFPRFDVGQNTK